MSLDNCEQCGKTCYVRVIGMSGGRAICSTCESTQVTDIDAACEAVIQAKNAEIERLMTELVQLRAHVAHNDEEYKVMKDVLRAEHQACRAMRPIVEAAKVWRDARFCTCRSYKCTLTALIDTIDAARGKL